MGSFTRISAFPKSGLFEFKGVDEYNDGDLISGNKAQSMVNFHIVDGKLKIRPRKRLWSVAFDDNILGMHEHIDSDGISRLEVASNGSIYEVDISSKTSRDSGLFPERLHFHTYRGRCYYNGSDGTVQRKITKTTASDIGIKAPEYKTKTSKTGTGLTGNYAWKYTFCIKENDSVVWESDPSPISDSVSLTNQGARITPAASPDNRVNARRIYRTTASGSIFQYENEIDNNTDGAYYDSGSVIDANLGNIVETNHGQPAKGQISEGCNERLFWIDRGLLRWSEQAHTEAYLEYQEVDNFVELPSTGFGTGIKKLNNPNTGKEDLFVFQKDCTSYLPSGDPNQPLIVLNNHVGCIQHDTIIEYNGGLVFLGNDNAVHYLKGGSIIDLSTLSLTKSITNALDKQYCRAGLIYNKYYALTIRATYGRNYNDKILVFDLSSIVMADNEQASIISYTWNIVADYILQLSDGSIIIADNSCNRLFKFTEEETSDEDANGTDSTPSCSMRFKNFGGDEPNLILAAKQINFIGKQQRGMSVIPYYGTDYNSTGASQDLTASGGVVFIVGTSQMGDALTTNPRQMNGQILNDTVGSYISFSLIKDKPDSFFELIGWNFTYNAFQIGVL